MPSINHTSETPKTLEPTIFNLDHLGLVCGMIDELGLGELIDTLLPSDASRTLSHGEAVKAMLLNGLGYVNQRLYLTPHFYADKPLKRLFGREIEAHQINDAVLGKTLDALYKYGVTELFCKLSSHTLRHLNLLPTSLHLDGTSFHTDGIYNLRRSQTRRSDPYHTRLQPRPSPGSQPGNPHAYY